MPHLYWDAQRLFKQHAIKNTAQRLSRHTVFSIVVAVWTWQQWEKTDLTPSRTSVRGLQTSSQFFHKRKATKRGSAHQFTLCAFCLLAFSLTLLLSYSLLLFTYPYLVVFFYFVIIIIIYTHNSILFRLCVCTLVRTHAHSAQAAFVYAQKEMPRVCGISWVDNVFWND